VEGLEDPIEDSETTQSSAGGVEPSGLLLPAVLIVASWAATLAWVVWQAW
jgi:hypothetical protein